MPDDARPAAIIFDFGYVLQTPADPAAFRARKDEMARQVGLESGQQLWNHIYVSQAWDRAKLGHMTEAEFWADRLARFGVEGQDAVMQFRASLLEPALGIHPTMRQLVHDLRRKFRLAVLSNIAVRDMARWLEDEHNLGGVFEVVVGSADVGLAKPDRAIYQLILARLDLPPERTLFVDDTPRNVDAAQELDIPAILFESPQALRAEFEQRGFLS